MVYYVSLCVNVETEKIGCVFFCVKEKNEVSVGGGIGSAGYFLI